MLARLLRALIAMSILVVVLHCGSEPERDSRSSGGSKTDGGRSDAGGDAGSGGDGGAECTKRWKKFLYGGSADVTDGALVLSVPASSEISAAQIFWPDGLSGPFHLRIDFEGLSLGTEDGILGAAFGYANPNGGKMIAAVVSSSEIRVGAFSDEGPLDLAEVAATSGTIELSREESSVTATIKAGGKTVSGTVEYFSGTYELRLGVTYGPSSVRITNITMVGDEGSPLNDSFDCDSLDE